MLSHSVYCLFDERILPDPQHRIAEIKPIYHLLHESLKGILFRGENSRKHKNNSEC